MGNEIDQVEILLEVDDVQSYTEVRACEGFKTMIQSEILPGDIDVTVFGIDISGQRVVSGRVTISREQFFEAPCDPVIRTLVLLDTCSQSNCES